MAKPGTRVSVQWNDDWFPAAVRESRLGVHLVRTTGGETRTAIGLGSWARSRDGFAKCFWVHSVIQGPGTTAELRRVNRERAELRTNIEQPWRLIFGSLRQDVPQDSNLLLAAT